MPLFPAAAEVGARRVRRSGSQRPSSVASGLERDASLRGSSRDASRPRQPSATDASASAPSKPSRVARSNIPRPTRTSRPDRPVASSSAHHALPLPASRAARARASGRKAAPSHAPVNTESAAATTGRFARAGSASARGSSSGLAFESFNERLTLEPRAGRAPFREMVGARRAAEAVGGASEQERVRADC